MIIGDDAWKIRKCLNCGHCGGAHYSPTTKELREEDGVCENWSDPVPDNNQFIYVSKKTDEAVKVSDWSQKYKLIIYAFSGMGIVYGLWLVIDKLDQIINLLSK